MIGLPCGEEIATILSRSDSLPERGRRTDGRKTEFLYQHRVSDAVLTQAIKMHHIRDLNMH